MRVHEQLFGVVIPGRPVVTDFEVIDSTKAITYLENPSTVPDIVLFLLPSTPIPPNHGAILYYATPPFQNWNVIGAISPDKPSGTFRTDWTTDEEMMKCPVVQLGISIEPMETIANLNLGWSGVEDRYAFAHKIALDLFRYMTSFSRSNDPGMMLVPNNIFDQWMQRFERKYKLDPNFMMKESI